LPSRGHVESNLVIPFCSTGLNMHRCTLRRVSIRSLGGVSGGLPSKSEIYTSFQNIEYSTWPIDSLKPFQIHPKWVFGHTENNLNPRMERQVEATLGKGPRMTHRGGLGPLILVSVILLSGCTMVGPNFSRPKVEMLPEWLEAGDTRVKSEAPEFRNWWRVFADPVLDNLIDRAYRGNLSLRIAGVRVLEARAQLGIAVGELYPQTQQAFGSLQYDRPSPAYSQSASSQGRQTAASSSAFPSSFWIG
jgi:hypothetical protein